MVTRESTGLRERKRRELYQRIAQTGLRLFVERGFDATTLDMIAEEAGIARRTFFAYFKTKDEIIRAWSRNGWEQMFDEVRALTPDLSPLAAVRDVLDRGIGRTDDALLRAIAKIVRESPELAETQLASYAERESALFDALCDVWPEPARRPALRVCAMVALGALRVAAEAWKREGSARSLRDGFRETFELMGAAVLEAGPR